MSAAAPPGSSPQADRRTALQLAAAGLAGLSAPAWAIPAGGFTHGVASGEPGADRVLLWTRYLGATDRTRLTYELSAEAEWTRPVAGGSVDASLAADGCAKVVATGLEPGRWYQYRFIAPDGRVSPSGRTRTLPAGPVPRFRLAAFSCCNLALGWFNAYAHAAARDDIDLLVHLGDYFYEYGVGDYPTRRQPLPGRTLDPPGETIALSDYRRRLAAYRSDPDLQRLHRLFPMIAMPDDHESANDSWKGGAGNHQPNEGPWNVRKAASRRAWREWLPVSDDDWAEYPIGDLATLFRVETRLLARDRQLDYAQALAGVPPGVAGAALARFRNEQLRSASRTLMGARQERWLGQALRRSVRGGARWQVLGQQVVMGELVLPREIVASVPATASPPVRQRLAEAGAASEAGLPYNLDQWDGYPAARERLLGAAQAAGANLIALAGDTHNAWAFDLDHRGTPAGVEFAVHSVTSPGAETSLPWLPPAETERWMVARNRQLKWCDLSHRGYLTVELTRERATCEWLMLDSVRQRSTMLAGRHALQVVAGSNRLAS